VFRQALAALLDQLQQSSPAELSKDELLASLEAVQTAVMQGVLSLDACQPLLHSLLKCSAPVDLTRVAQAIAHYSESLEPIELLSEQALAPASAATAVSHQKPAPIRGATYRADVHSPRPAPAVSALHEPANAGNQDWITPSRVAKPGAVALLSTETTLPTLVSRPAKKSLAAPAEPASAKSAARPKKEKSGRTQLQAQTEWFALVTSNDAKVLPRLQELAAGYPDLLNQKSPGKKGQSALFHALTQGRKEMVAWLLAHEQQNGVADLGTFLVEAQDEIGIVERRHVAAFRLLLDSAVKRYDQKISDEHARQLPDASPLSRKALLERRTALLSDPHKVALGQSAQLRPLLEEYKLIEPQRAASLAGSAVKKPVTSTSILRPIATLATSQSSETNRGMTSLMQAAANGDTEQVKAILGAASNKDQLAQARQINGATALMIAAGRGDAQTATAILNDVTDKDTLAQMQDNWGMTALIRAAIGGNADTVAVILSEVQDKDTLAQMRDMNQMTALLSASLANRADVVTALLKGVGDKDAMAQMKDSQGLTALMCATLLGHTASVKAVLEHVNDTDTLVGSGDIHGATALMRAAIAGNTQLVQLILNAVDDKDTAAQMADGLGITALMRAASSGRLESTMAILNGVSRKLELAQQRDRRGMTAAMKAVSEGHPAIATAIDKALAD
jgi:ankyrin repeat protein